MGWSGNLPQALLMNGSKRYRVLDETNRVRLVYVLCAVGISALIIELTTSISGLYMNGIIMLCALLMVGVLSGKRG